MIEVAFLPCCWFLQHIFNDHREVGSIISLFHAVIVVTLAVLQITIPFGDVAYSAHLTTPKYEQVLIITAHYMLFSLIFHTQRDVTAYIHHTVLIVSMCYGLFTKRCQYLFVLLMLNEISTIFLNLSKIVVVSMKTFMRYAFALTFTVFRICLFIRLYFFTSLTESLLLHEHCVFLVHMCLNVCWFPFVLAYPFHTRTRTNLQG